MGKSPAMPPPIWKKPTEDFGAVDRYHSARHIIVSMPPLTVWGLLTLPSMQRAAKTLPSVESSQPGTKIGRFFSQAASIQLSFGSISYAVFCLKNKIRRYMNSYGK